MLELLTALIINLETDKQVNPIIRLNSSQPAISAKASLIADLNSQTILHKHNIHTKLPIASLTKLMTALIILEEHQLDEPVTIPYAATQINGSKIHLTPNSVYTVEALLKALLIQSANDATLALAIHNSQSIDNFVKKMNLKARKLKLFQTSFQNPIGFDHPKNYSSIADLYQLSQILYKLPFIQEVSQIQTVQISSTTEQHTHSLVNTNRNLSNYLQSIGLKTGTTPSALECLITITPNQQLSIVLGSPNRYLDSKTLHTWAEQTFYSLN